MADPVTRFKLARAESHAGAIALVTIDNGEDHTKPNVFGRAALESLARTLDELERGEWVALVLTGKPFVFAAGADLSEFPKIRDAEQAKAASRAGHELFGRIRALPYPTVAAVNGACLGAGLELAVGCDIIVAAETATFGMPEIEVGIPSVIEAALLVDLIGALRTKEFLLTGDRWEAATAERYGMVNYVVPPAELLPRARAICHRIAEHSRTAVALQKDLVNRWMTTDLDTAIEYGVNALGVAFTTGDPQEAMAAFQEKRPPRFTWRDRG